MPPKPPFVLIDDARVPAAASGGAQLYTNPSQILTCERPEDVPTVLKQIDQALDDGHHVAGYLAYELGYALEPKLMALMPNPLSGPLIWMGVFDAPQVLKDDMFEAWARDIHGVGDMRTTLGQNEYITQVEKIRAHIRAGDVYQINHTFKQRFDFSGSPLALYAQLRQKQRARYSALIATGERHILSLSPELFVTRNGANAQTRPMKGTAARAANPDDDEARKYWLCHDEKSKAENLMIVDLLRNDLSRIAELGSVQVTDLFTVETYPTLHQMTSGIEAKLSPGITFSDTVKALFPCGSVTGTPKFKAMEIIRSLETEPRGVYTGAIGCAAPQDVMRFNVAIRTIELSETQGEMGIGSGIVYDSDPGQEWQECHLKARFLTAPHQPFALLETLLWEPDKGFALLDLHIARLAASARYFCYPYDEIAVKDALSHVIPNDCETSLRLRFLLNEDGAIKVDAAPFAPPPTTEKMRFVLATQPIDRTIPFVYHKTTNRAFYDDERIRQQREYDCDEVLFLNETGELTEGSITNLFIKRGNVLLTPPVSCGLLAGTLRQNLIDTGRAVEAVLTPSDLKTGDAIYLGNSLRGLVSAQHV